MDDVTPPACPMAQCASHPRTVIHTGDQPAHAAVTKGDAHSKSVMSRRFRCFLAQRAKRTVTRGIRDTPQVTSPSSPIEPHQSRTMRRALTHRTARDQPASHRMACVDGVRYTWGAFLFWAAASARQHHCCRLSNRTRPVPASGYVTGRFGLMRGEVGRRSPYDGFQGSRRIDGRDVVSEA
jgi:hypothetical protein